MQSFKKKITLSWLNGLLLYKLYFEPTQTRREYQTQAEGGTFESKSVQFKSWRGLLKGVIGRHIEHLNGCLAFRCCGKRYMTAESASSHIRHHATTEEKGGRNTIIGIDFTERNNFYGKKVWKHFERL